MRFRAAGRWFLALTIVSSVLALGSVHPVSLTVLAALAGTSAALLFRRSSFRTSARVLLWLCAGLTAYTLLQAIPLPTSFIAAIAPHNADVWERALRPFGEAGPRWITLSVDPVATRIQVARGIVYLLTLVGALEVARSKEGVRFLMITLGVAGAALALAALLHPAFDQSKVFGFYTPSKAIAPRHIAPLLNANHLSAYINISICCVVAMALEPELGRARILPACIAFLLIAMQFWVASRGGVVAMVLGLALIGALRVLRPTQRAIVAPISIALVIFAGVAMAVFGQSDDAWVELADTETSKLRFFSEVFPMLHAYPLFGAGRGAFESAFPEFRSGLGYVVFTHPENIVLQWSSEWGLAVTLLAFATLGFALRPTVALARGSWAVGAWAALAAVGMHNLVDFSSETPGVVVALCVCAAIVAGGAPSAVAERRRYGLLRISLAVAGCVGTALAGLQIGIDVGAERDALRTDTSSTFDCDLRGAMLRHPAEPYLPYLGALHARTSKKNVVPWIERTLERAPVYGSAHLLLASQLMTLSPAQARLEERIGIEQIDENPTTVAVAQEAVKRGLVRSYDEAMDLAPTTGAQRLTVLAVVSGGVAQRLPATARRLDDTIIASAPTSQPLLLLRRAAAGLTDLRDGVAAPWCAADRIACETATLALVGRFEAASPQSCEGQALEANIRIESGDRQTAFTRLKAFTRSVPQTAACLVPLAQVAIATNLPDEATHAIDDLAHAPCATPTECVMNLMAAGSVESERDNMLRAIAFYEKALETMPERDDISVTLAEAALNHGLYMQAERAYQRLLDRHPGDAKYVAGLAKSKDGAVRNSVDLSSVPP